MDTGIPTLIYGQKVQIYHSLLFYQEQYLSILFLHSMSFYTGNENAIIMPLLYYYILLQFLQIVTLLSIDNLFYKCIM